MKTKIILLITIFLLILLVWAPWITEEYAVNKVTEKLGGSDAQFFYLDKTMPVKEIPKDVGWFPFGKTVVFPSEAVWFITFWGEVY